MIPPKTANKIVCLFGKTGTGKTHYLQERIIRPSVLPCIVVDTLDEYGDYAIESSITDDIRFDMFKMRFRPMSDLDFDIVCRCVSEQRFRDGVNFVVEETDQFVSEHRIPRNFLRLLYQSRHYNINVYLSVHSPVDMNSKIRNICHRFLVFRLTEHNYLQYFGRIDPALPAKIRTLKTDQYVEIVL